VQTEPANLLQMGGCSAVARSPSALQTAARFTFDASVEAPLEQVSSNVRPRMRVPALVDLQRRDARGQFSLTDAETLDAFPRERLLCSGCSKLAAMTRSPASSTGFELAEPASGGAADPFCE